jgi:hypothetical protein
MHTQRQLESAYRAIDAVMAIATDNLDSFDQQNFEIDALALYLGAQIASLSPEHRSDTIERLVASIDEVIATRSKEAA